MKFSSISDNLVYARLQNLRNFCRHHIGDWYGNWTVYNSTSELIDSFKCLRSLRFNQDCSKIEQYNRFFAVNSKSPLLLNYRDFQKSTVTILSLDQSYSCGSTVVNPNSLFSFEIGFRHKARRESLVVQYSQHGELDYILTISEHLGSFAQYPFISDMSELSDWYGTLTMISPEQIVSPTVAILWMQLNSLSQDYLTLHLNNISVSLPAKLENNKEFFLVAQWLVNPTLLQRGIRYFDASGFTGFTLEVFNREV